MLAICSESRRYSLVHKSMYVHIKQLAVNLQESGWPPAAAVEYLLLPL